MFPSDAQENIPLDFSPAHIYKQQEREVQSNQPPFYGGGTSNRSRIMQRAIRVNCFGLRFGYAPFLIAYARSPGFFACPIQQLSFFFDVFTRITLN